MKLRYGWLAPIAAFGVIASGCADMQSKREAAGQLAMDHKAASSTPAASTADAGFGGGAQATPGGGMAAYYTADTSNTEQSAKLTLASMTDSQQDRYLIKNASITIEAGDVRKAAQQARDTAKSADGYISSSHETVDNLGLRSITLEIRVPAPVFDASMSGVEATGRVLDNQITSEDVTEQYVDTDAQLRNLKDTEARLLAHLQQAGKLSDILQVETEVSRVRSSIDQLEGKLRFMSHRISYSTISITFKEPAHVEPITPPESFSMLHVASEAMRSFTGFLQSVITAGVWILVWSVLWLPVLAGARVLYMRLHAARHVRA